MFKKIARTVALGIVLAGAPVAVGAGSASAQSAACGTSVTVTAGDTLNRIAARCGLTLSQILAVNPQIVNPNVIFVGQAIRLVAGGTVARPSQPVPPQTGGVTYRVRPGDTLSAIARRHNVPLSRIIAANPRIDPNRISVGISIVIPGIGSITIGTPQPPPSQVLQTVVGHITNEGVTCLAMRDDRGRLFTLTGNVRNLAPGDRVEIRGVQAQFSICQQGTTIEVREVRRLAAGTPQQGTVRVTGMLTNEGVECQAMRGGDGRLYTFTRIAGFRAGDFVEVRGTLADFSFCQQGTTINVTQIARY